LCLTSCFSVCSELGLTYIVDNELLAHFCFWPYLHVFLIGSPNLLLLNLSSTWCDWKLFKNDWLKLYFKFLQLILTLPKPNWIINVLFNKAKSITPLKIAFNPESTTFLSNKQAYAIGTGLH
jgi:hypothetical protein